MNRRVLIMAVLLATSVLNAQEAVESRLLKGWNTIKPEDTFALVKKMVEPEFGGRFTGHPKYAAASKWAASLFKQWNLKPIDEKNGYLQAYNAPYAVIDQAKLDVIQDGARTTAAIPRDFMPLIFSDSGSAKAEAVFVGWGIHAPELGYDDFAGVNVKGKFLLCFRGTPDSDPKWVPYDAHRARMQMAHKQGALGLIYIYAEVIAHNNSDLIKGFFQAMVSDEVGDRIFKAHGTSVAALKKQLKDTKKPASMPVGAGLELTVKGRHYPEGIGYNVVGYVEGSDPLLKQEFVVVGGHFDGVGEHLGLFFPGADDNASGSAVVMEAAEALAKNEVRPKRSVMFVLFGGEELGGTGSDYFVANLPAPIKTVVGLLNFDMEGLGDKVSASMSAPLLALKDLLVKADVGLGLVGRIGETRSVGNRSGDITPFFRKGYPIASIMSNGDRPKFSYHLPGDSLDIVQPAIMANISRLTYRWAFYLADR